MDATRLIPLVLAAAASLGQGGDRLPFDVSSQLDGYAECAASEWRDLYDLDEFAILDGVEMSPAELADVRERWAAEVARVRALIGEIQADGRRLFLYHLERAVPRHPYFSEVACTRVDGAPPYVFFIQPSPSRKESYERRVLADYAALLGGLAERFEHDYAAPLGLTRRADHGAFAVFVLASEGDASNYAKAARPLGHYRARAYYDSKLSSAVVFEDPFKGRDLAEKRRSALHALGHVLQQSYSSPGGDVPADEWLAEGFADYLASRGDGAAPPSDTAESIRAFVGAATDPESGWANRYSLEELLVAPSYGRLASVLSERAAALGKKDSEWGDPHLSLMRQASLLVRFFEDGYDGRHRSAFRAYLKAYLERRADRESFERCFAPLTVEALDQEFLLWVIAEHHRAWPNEPLDLDGLLAAGAAPATTAPRASVGPAPADTAAPVRNAFPSLAVPMPGAEIRFALALRDARAGRTAAALQSVEQLLASGGDPAFTKRLEVERTRISRWNGLRDRFLTSLAGTKERLEVAIGGESAKVEVLRFEAGVVHVGKSRLGIDRVAADAIDPSELARQMGKKVSELDAPWVRIYPYVLANDAKWKSLLKPADDESRALRDDGERDYPDRLRLGDAVAELEALSLLEAPVGAVAARAALQRLGDLESKGGDLAPVRERSAAIEACRAECFGAIFDEEGPSLELAGKVQALDQGRIKVIYEFDDAAELEDFRSGELLQDWRKAFPPLDDSSDAFAVEQGMLRGSGRACLQHVLAFEGPTALRYDLRFAKPADGSDPTVCFVAGICRAGEYEFAACSSVGSLIVSDPKGDTRAGDDRRVVCGASYAMEIRCDGASKIEILRDGAAVADLPCGSRTKGGVFLWTHTDLPVTLSRLEIEGRPEPASLARLRSAWIAEQIAGF